MRSNKYYYYEAIEVSVDENGIYTLSSYSEMETYGNVYVNKFNPFDPSANQIICNNYGGCNVDFKLTPYLQKQQIYILMVSPSASHRTGSFLVTALGPNKVTLKHTGEYISDVYYISSTTAINRYAFIWTLVLIEE